METKISADEMERALDARLKADGDKSAKIAAYRCSNGLQIALTRDQDTSRLWLESKPPTIAGLSDIKYYKPSGPRTSNLNGQRGSRLAIGNVAYNVEVSTLLALDDLLAWYTGSVKDEAYRTLGSDVTMTKASHVSLNTILYGPPGTSKTYETIDYALKIIDPAFAAKNADSRPTLKNRFDQLRRDGRIEFLTFHQSYSYEDFVEGIKATTEDGVISYQVEDGVFKRLCIRARVTSSDEDFQQALNAFKLSIADEPAELKTKRGDIFTVWWTGGSTLRVRPHAGAPNADYSVSVDNIERRYRGESDSGMYNLSYVRAVMAHVIEHWNVKPFKESPDRQPYVMIIDEINRGNIASIFGELITLIEPSKRHGADEELSATLPYSKISGGFTVPDNLYIIGTMNTADRSLSRVDTALRRRFEFVPMYPRPELLDGVMVDDIDVGTLLRAMNERIELLYDRDHLLGHAFFMSLKYLPEERRLTELATIFRTRIIPLLEEYFFDDWARIRLVLGDDTKSSAEFQFVFAESGVSVFAGKGDLGGSKAALIRFSRNDEALMRTESYRQTYVR